MTRARDWLLLLVSAAFTVAGLALWLAGRGSGGLAAAIFFGACTGVAVWILRSKATAGRQALDPGLEVRVGEGFGEVIVGSRRRQWAAGVGLVVFGAALAWTGGPIGQGFVAVSWILAGCGAALLVALGLGFRAGHALVFAREALWIGGRDRYPLHWDNIAGAEVFELQSNLLVRVHLHAPARAVDAAEGREGVAGRVARAMATTQAMIGAPVMIHPGFFGVDPVVLVRALERYATSPGAREELRPRAAITA